MARSLRNRLITGDLKHNYIPSPPPPVSIPPPPCVHPLSNSAAVQQNNVVGDDL